MAQKKLVRFAEIKTFPNVLEYPTEIKGRWKEFFKNENPITLELACGKGEYTVSLAEKYPDRNFIGVDIKGNRLWVGAKKALNSCATNALFLRSQIEMIDHYFTPGEVADIWITFPDPQLRASKAKKRLTHPHFLRLYQKFLQPQGLVRLKTDSPDLYNFTRVVIELFEMEIVSDINDVHADSLDNDLEIKTYYESLDIAGSKKIFYLAFKLNGIDVDKDQMLKDILETTSSSEIKQVKY